MKSCGGGDDGDDDDKTVIGALYFLFYRLFLKYICLEREREGEKRFGGGDRTPTHL